MKILKIMFSIKGMKFPYTIRKIETIGDGSCFLHAILRAIWPDYEKMGYKEKRKTVRTLRDELAVRLEEKDEKGISVYQKLSDGKLPELSKSIPHVKLEEMKKFLKSDNFFDQLYFEFISDTFNIDIYVIDYSTEKIYNMGYSTNQNFYKDRNSIIIGYGNQHFETLEIEVRPGHWKTFFKHDSEIIKIINPKTNK